MWTAPRVNCQLKHAPRYAVTSGLRCGITHLDAAGAQTEPFPPFTGSAVTALALIDTPFRMDEGLSGQWSPLDPWGLLRRSLIASVSSRHFELSEQMTFSVVARHEQRVFLPVSWFSPRSRHRSPHHGVRKLRGLNVTRAVLFD
jgi:hypothetical protein